MFAKRIATGLLAAAGVLVATGSATAGDTVRLNLTGATAAPTLKLGQISPDADTVDVAGRGGFGGGRGGFGGGHIGGFRGGAVGFRGGHVGGFRSGAVGFRGGHIGGFRGGFVGHRGFYGGYRGYYGGYRGYYGGYGYGGYGGYYGGYPGYYGGYCYPYATYYAAPAYYYYSMPYVCGVSDTVTTSPGVVGLRSNVAPYLDGVPGNGTYPYDGGPRNLQPMPQIDPVQPTPTEGRPVALPIQPAKRTYPAYGEKPRPTTPAPAKDRTTLVKT